jgi:hypothetical protein
MASALPVPAGLSSATHSTGLTTEQRLMFGSTSEVNQVPNSDAVERAKDHVALIRRKKGLDQADSPEPSEIELTLKRAIKIISQDFYSDSTHFLLELIQNADDNSFNEVVPTISFRTSPGHLLVECNEVGFVLTDVEAISTVDDSTKKDRKKGYIGQKGIGFKSVFKIADIVWISSQAYKFKFDRHARLGVIAPIWEEFPGEVRSGWTQFYLQLRTEEGLQAEEQLGQQLQRFDPTTLLFLKRLRKVDIFVANSDWQKQHISHVTRTDTRRYGGQTIVISKHWAKVKKAYESLQYFVVRHVVNGMPAEQKRMGVQSSEVVLAFPFIEDKPAFHSQKAYAFLPVRESGLRVSSASISCLFVL